MNKICVYTCITGNYDNVKEIKTIEDGIDYYCFTNNRKLESNTWKVIYIDNEEELSNVKLARKIKVLGHPTINKNYDILLWMDGSVTFNKSIKSFINYYLTDEDNFVAFKHSQRKNIREECYACVRMRKETKENIQKLLKFYDREKYKYDNGLIESTVYIKRMKNKQVENTLKIWFDMIKIFSKRDQLSFNYAIYKSELNVKWINENVFDNKWFSCESHNYEQEIKSYRVYFNDYFSKEYNMEHDFQGNFDVQDNNKYVIELTVPCNTKKTVVELPRVPFIKLKDIEINQKKDIDIYYFNSLKYDNQIVFYNENGAFEFYNELKKDSKLTISLNLDIMKSLELSNLIEYQEKKYEQVLSEKNKLEEFFQKSNNEINKLKLMNLELQKELNNILNSRSWRLIRKFDKFRKYRKEV